MLHQAALQLGLHPRPYKKAVMVTPPSNKSRMLFSFWVTPDRDGRLRFYSSSEAFQDFFPVTAQEALDHLGEDGWRGFDEEATRRFLEGLHELLRLAQERSATDRI